MSGADRLARWRQQVDGWLAAWVEGCAGPPQLREAMAYSLLGGGKRLRPVLALAAAEAVGGREATGALRDFCCAVEMVHTYSLIHDDLPSMDDDDLRRGRPTSHRVHGEALAILAGDALLTEAFGVLSVGDEPALRLALVAQLARAAGESGMVGGQVLDVQRSARGSGLESVEGIHRMKTGALIAASAAGGARAAGGSADALAALERFGRDIGLAFQIVDDVLDEVGETEAMGKTAGKDAARGTATVPQVLGVEGARARAAALTSAALAELERFGPAADGLREAAARLTERRA